MSSLFYVAVAIVALLLGLATASVLVAMRRARSGQTAVRVEASPGAPGGDVALRLVLYPPDGAGRSFLRAIAVEGDLARVLELRPPVGFAPYITSDLRYEEFEPDLDALADRLDRERPKTVELSSVIERLQREQFARLQDLRDEIDAVQFTANLPVGPGPLRIALPGRPIPEATGKLWVTTVRRIGAASVEDVVQIEVPLDAASPVISNPEHVARVGLGDEENVLLPSRH